MLARAAPVCVSRTRTAPARAPVQRPLALRRYTTNAPANLKYTKSHEWIKVEGNVGTVGITDYAQKALGDVVFVDLPAVGKKFNAGGSFGAVESVKAASDVYAPVAGEVTEVNKALSADPSIVNQSAYEKGWMIKLKLSNPKELEKLLDSKAYAKEVDNAKH